MEGGIDSPPGFPRATAQPKVQPPSGRMLCGPPLLPFALCLSRDMTVFQASGNPLLHVCPDSREIQGDWRWCLCIRHTAYLSFWQQNGLAECSHPLHPLGSSTFIFNCLKNKYKRLLGRKDALPPKSLFLIAAFYSALWMFYKLFCQEPIKD